MRPMNTHTRAAPAAQLRSELDRDRGHRAVAQCRRIIQPKEDSE